MSTPDSKPKVNTQIYDEAAEWLVELRLGDLDAAARNRLDVWFRESPHHIRAFLELSSIWEDGGDPDLDRHNSTDALIAHARTVSNVVPLERVPPNPRPDRVAESSPDKSASGERAGVMAMFSWRSALAASVLIAGAAAFSFWLYDRLAPTYVTRTGEEKSIRLADGSTIELNSRSRVRVRFSEHERDIDLLEGQALFSVAKNAARPFVVHSNSASVRAVGTQFDVYRRDSATTVTVVEGQVAVLPRQPEASPAPELASTSAGERLRVGAVVSAHTILLAAGEQVTVSPASTPRPVRTDVANATAWTQHQLAFESTPLKDVAQEFNRYNARQLVVDDTDLKEFHVTGVFSSTDPASLLRFLRAQRGIRVEETDKSIRISRN
jgi:transmembrane sensor